MDSHKYETIRVCLAYLWKSKRIPEHVTDIQNLIMTLPEFEVSLERQHELDDTAWIEETRKNVENCHIFCIVVTMSLLTSTWIKNIIQWAKEANKLLLPIFVEDVIRPYEVLNELGLSLSQYVYFDGAKVTSDEIIRILIQMEAVIKSQLQQTPRRKILLKKNTLTSNMTEVSNRIFGNPSVDNQFDCDIFMIMPFASPFDDIYLHYIKPVVTDNLKLKIKRGDNFFAAHAVMTDVWSAMFNSYLVIAECTGRNANVFYELGMAHALNKSTIMLTQNIDDIPFDIRHLRHIQYQNTPGGLKKLEKDLKVAISLMMFGEEIE